jgi:hypothetical protein
MKPFASTPSSNAKRATSACRSCSEREIIGVDPGLGRAGTLGEHHSTCSDDSFNLATFRGVATVQ